MRHIRTILFISLLLTSLMPGIVSAQRISHFGVADGLSSSYVVGLTQDRKGYIWIATESGLNRFDGRQFVVYNRKNSGLSSNELNVVLADPCADKVWIGTQRNGLCCFDYATETITNMVAGEDGLSSNDIPTLTLASDSGIWITHYYMGIQHYDTRNNVLTTYNYLTVEDLPGRYWTAADDGQGFLYVGHVRNGLSVINMKDMSLRNYTHDPADPNSIPGNEVRSLCIDRHKNIWLGTNQGIALFNPANGQFTSFRHQQGDPYSLLPGTVMDIKQMKNGDLWFATDMGGVSILDMQANTFKDISNIRFQNLTVTEDGRSLAGPYVRCLLQDSYGNIWIGNYRDGLDFVSYNPESFKTLPYITEQLGKSRYKQVWSLCIDHNQNLWMGGLGELAFYREGEKIQTIPLPISGLHPHAYVKAIYEDRRQRLWVGTWEAGLFCYDPVGKKFTQISGNGSFPADIRCFYEDDEGKLWIGARDGVYSYINGRLTNEKEINGQLFDHIVQSICRDADGKLWVGTFGKGIYIFSPEGKLLVNHQLENKFPSNAINSLTIDSEGRIWAATREGVILFPNIHDIYTYHSFGDAEGLANTQVRAVCEDRDGNIWVSTNAGISRLNETQKWFYNYDHRNGVPLGNFMDGAAAIDAEGSLFFASQNGTCFFFPSSLEEMQSISPVTITRFFVYRQTESQDMEVTLPLTSGKIKLPYDENTFKISFNVLDYTQSPQVEFAYRMEGLSDTWYNAQGENGVTYRNIPPGKYTFKVRARFRNQDWEEKVAVLPITITPPFWLAWYAKLLYCLLGLVIIYLIIRFYKHRLDLESSLEVERENSRNKQALNEERLRFYTNITHELRTPLTLILGPLEDLLNDSGLSPKYANKISIIHDSAARLLNLINGILEFRKTETQNRKLSVARGDISELVQEIGLRYKELNRNPKVNFEVRIETTETRIFYDADMLTTILNNFLSNAAKYTSEGSITLALRSVEEKGLKYTEISVSDTGHGIPPEALPHIFERYYQASSKYQASGSGIGLALVKGLADLHEATLSVSSEVEVGTTFYLRLLTDNSYPNALHTDVHPLTEGDAADFAGAFVENGSDDAQAEDTRPLLLVVEDNMDIREYVRQSFSDDFEILTAEDGSQGWQLAQEHIPNIIVSDIMMPVMDGIQLCRLVKDDIRTSHIPVILLTAKDSLQDKEEGYTAGADSYLTKPFSAKLLHSRINNLLDMRKRLAARLTAIAPATNPEPTLETDDALNPLDNEFLQRVTQIIEDNLEMDGMDIAFIADKMCMSHSTLYRKLKGVADISPNEFIRKVKMKNGVSLLLSKKYSISEISYMTGFSSVGYFRQCFKREFGMTPSDYVSRNGGA